MLSIERNFVMSVAEFNYQVIEQFANSKEIHLTSCIKILNFIKYRFFSYGAVAYYDNRYG